MAKLKPEPRYKLLLCAFNMILYCLPLLTMCGKTGPVCIKEITFIWNETFYMGNFLRSNKSGLLYQSLGGKLRATCNIKG